MLSHFISIRLRRADGPRLILYAGLCCAGLGLAWLAWVATS